MAWGAARGSQPIDDLVARLAADDPSLTALALLPARRFASADAASLATALARNAALRELHLGGRPLPAGGGTALAAALVERGTPLALLSVGDASLACAGVAALAAGLAAGVIEADLELRGVGAAGVAALAAALADAVAPSLRTLRLARNPLGCAGATALVPGMRWLAAVDVSGCGVGDAGVSALAAALAGAPSLARLVLGANPDVTPAGVAALADALSAAPALASLSLAGCARVADAGAASLAAALPLCSLLDLDLCGCGIGAAGAASLAGALAQEGCALESLFLRGSTDADADARGETDSPPLAVVGDEGALALAAALAGGSSLRSLDVGAARMRAAGAAALAAAPGLTALTLSGNPLNDDGGVAIAVALSSAAELRSLDLAACALCADGAAALAAAITAGAAPSLHTLVLGGNPATEDDGMEGLVAGLRAARPGLDVAWRVADSGGQDGPPRPVA